MSDWDDFESDDEDFDAQEYFESNFTINGQPIRFDNSSSDDTILVGEAIDSAIAGTLSGVEMGLKKAGIPYKPGGIVAALDYLAK